MKKKHILWILLLTALVATPPIYQRFSEARRLKQIKTVKHEASQINAIPLNAFLASLKATPPEKTLLVLYTGSTYGHLEPCGCFIGPEKTLPPARMWPLSAEEKKQQKIASQHFKNFLEHLTTNPESARTELDSYATIIFQNHPLTEEWKKLCFRIVRDKEGNVPDMLRFIEIRKQMLIDQDPARYAKEIKGLSVFLISLKRIAQKFERQGILETEKIPFNLKITK